MITFKSCKFIKQYNNQDLYLSDDKVAISQCLPEVSEALTMIFGS